MSGAIETIREKFIKALFLCLFLCTSLSVDKTLQPMYSRLYSDSKPCAALALRALDKSF
jgi:hypothetical protein